MSERRLTVNAYILRLKARSKIRDQLFGMSTDLRSPQR